MYFDLKISSVLFKQIWSQKQIHVLISGLITYYYQINDDVCVWICQMKIKELELKLQEEKHQRKLVQEKANQVTKKACNWIGTVYYSLKGFNLQFVFYIIFDLFLMSPFYVLCAWQLQASLEANRILLHSVSPHWSRKQSPERFSSKVSCSYVYMYINECDQTTAANW